MKKITRNVFLVSLGCPKNLVDSEIMLGALEQAGYCVCDSAQSADLLLINTCGFIQSAVEEAIEEILALAQIKKEFPEKRLVVTGCLVQRYGTELQKEIPEVDLFIGTDGFQNIIAELDTLTTSQTPVLSPLLVPSFVMNASMPRSISTPPHRAYLKITEGCSNRCSYCMIPSLRGDLRSRSPEDLLREVDRLNQDNIKELTLIAQDLTAYGLDFGKKDINLVTLLKDILANSSIPWMRLLYLYPVRLKDELLDLMAKEPRLLPYLDLPLQHVSDRILKLMNRPYSLAETENLIKRIRLKLPESTIRTTFMVGFPGETDDDMDILAKFMEEFQLDNVGVFTYSNEEGCKAENLPNHCSEEVKEERRDRLMTIQASIAKEKNSRFIGKTEQVLVEGVSKETDLLLEGRTRFQAPDIDGCVYINSGECLPGDIVNVTFSEAHIYDLVGEIV